MSAARGLYLKEAEQYERTRSADVAVIDATLPINEVRVRIEQAAQRTLDRLAKTSLA